MKPVLFSRAGPAGRWTPATRWAAVALGVAGVVLAVALFGILPRLVARAVSHRLVAEAARRGLTLRMSAVRVGWTGPAVLSSVDARRPDGTGLSAREVSVDWAFVGHGALDRVRGVGVRGLAVDLPGGLHVAVTDSDWILERPGEGRLRVRRGGRAEVLTVVRIPGGDRVGWRLVFGGFPVGQLLSARRAGTPFPKGGTWTGTVEGWRSANGFLGAGILLHVRGTQLPSATEAGGGAAWGAPFDADVALEATGLPASLAGAALLDVPCWRVSADAIQASGSLLLAVSDEDAFLDASIDEGRLDLGRAFDLSGVPRPPALTGAGDLGIATFSWEVTGSLARPSDIAVAQELKFDPPPGARRGLAAYRGPFTYEAPLPDGGTRPIHVAPESSDFVPLAEVPPLFVRALLVSEDAAFRGHRGIDLTAIPVAAALNMRSGGPLRGGSTITQQLAKNLFLSRERTYSRKLQELALALLLDAALPKDRILEIYLNVIEWGPSLFGLRPAARHYFGKEPADLTPKETAFLVALIPGPRKYQASFAGGRLAPGLGRLVTRILAMLRSVGALTEEEYEAARSEPLEFREGLFPRRPEPPGTAASDEDVPEEVPESASPLPEQPHDLSGFGKTAGVGLGEDLPAVGHDVEDAS